MKSRNSPGDNRHHCICMSSGRLCRASFDKVMFTSFDFYKDEKMEQDQVNGAGACEMEQISKMEQVLLTHNLTRWLLLLS